MSIKQKNKGNITKPCFLTLIRITMVLLSSAIFSPVHESLPFASFIKQQKHQVARPCSLSWTPRCYKITCAITRKLRGIQAIKSICLSQSVLYQVIFLQETLRQLYFWAFISNRFVFSLQIKHAQQYSHFRHFQYFLETGKHST